jgi:hypothetical protein
MSNNNGNSKIVSIETIAKAIKQTYPRRAKGLGAKAPEYKNARGRSATPPCLFLLNQYGNPIKNIIARPYITTALESSLNDLADNLNAAGCIIDTKNKVLSVVINTPEFERLAHVIVQKMLSEIRNSGFVIIPNLDLV